MHTSRTSRASRSSFSQATTPRGEADRSNSHGTSMRIRQFPQSMTSEYVNTIWQHLRAAIQEIQRKNNSGLSFEELYRNAYTMVLHKHGDRLYTGTRDQVSEHLRNDVRPMILASTSTDNTLKVLMNAWQDHRTSMTMIRDILMYMDRVHVQANNIDNVDTMGIKLFREQIICFGAIENKVRELLLRRVDECRKGINRHLQTNNVKEVCLMLIQLGVSSKDVYVRVFESEFLKKTKEFYTAEATRLIESSSASDYVKKVNERLKEEDELTRRFLDPTSCDPVKKVIIEVMVKERAEQIVNMESSGVVKLIDELENRKDDIRNMHELLLLDTSNHSKAVLLQVVENKLRAEGEKIVTEWMKDAPTYIQKLITLKNRYDYLIEKSFDAERKEYKTAQTKSFEKFMNLKEARSAEYLVQHIDQNFKKSKPSSTVRSTAQARLADGPVAVVSLQDINGCEDTFKDQCITLFRLLQDKDAFEKYYKDSLANRMLKDQVSNDDLEISMISDLKKECGTTFTNKLEQMLTDKKTYKSTNERYKANRQTTAAVNRSSVELTCKILTQGTWPEFLTKELVASQEKANGEEKKLSSLTDTEHLKAFPEDMVKAWEDFKRFYLHDHSGRKLTLLPLHGSCDVRFMPKHAKKGRKFTITTFPSFALILSRFNEKTQWGYKDLYDRMPSYDQSKFKVSMQVLVDKFKVLQKVGGGSEMNDEEASASSSSKPKTKFTISENDVYEVNDTYDGKKVRFNITPVFKTKEAADNQNRQEAQLKIDSDRRHEIEAAIVRIMKARKEHKHNLLVAEVIEQLSRRFKAQPAIIKQKIEGLIEREYIRRTEGDRETYEYMA